MGMEFMLIKPDKNEYFDLSKGRWSELARSKEGYHKPVFLLRDIYNIQSELAEFIDTEVFEDIDFIYVNKLANYIWDWCGYDRIMLLNDTRFTKNLDNLDIMLSMYGTRSYSDDHFTLNCTADRFEISQDE